MGMALFAEQQTGDERDVVRKGSARRGKVSAVGSCRGLRSTVSVQGDGLGPGVAPVSWHQLDLPAQKRRPEEPRPGPCGQLCLQDSDCVAMALGFGFSDPPPRGSQCRDRSHAATQCVQNPKVNPGGRRKITVFT